MPVMQTVLDKFQAAGGDQLLLPVSASSRLPRCRARRMRSKYGTVEEYFTTALGIDAAFQQTLTTCSWSIIQEEQWRCTVSEDVRSPDRSGLSRSHSGVAGHARPTARRTDGGRPRRRRLRQLGATAPTSTPRPSTGSPPALRTSRFHTTALLSARAALLTGRNHHSVGMGTVPEIAMGYPGYPHASRAAGMLPEVRDQKCAP
jgi:hypothetical protein